MHTTPATRWTVATLAGATGAAVVGVLAARARDDASDAVSFTVFALVALPFLVALVAVALDRTDHPERSEDSIESQWATRASSGAFYDVVTAMGLTLLVSSVLDAPTVPLLVFVALALVDMGVRLALLQRREG